jgi:hypothetical protein
MLPNFHIAQPSSVLKTISLLNDQTHLLIRGSVRCRGDVISRCHSRELITFFRNAFTSLETAAKAFCTVCIAECRLFPTDSAAVMKWTGTH